MISNTTIITYQLESQLNSDRLLELIRQHDIGLFLIAQELEVSGVNPRIIPSFIRRIAEICKSTGYGKLIAYMEKGTISNIVSEIKEKVNLPSRQPESITIESSSNISVEILDKPE